MARPGRTTRVAKSKGPSADGTRADVQTLTEVARLLFAEVSRKKPRDGMIESYSSLFQDGLVELRISANGGDVSAGRAIDEIRDAVVASLSDGAAEPVAIMLIARAFAEAQIDPGPALQQGMMQALETLPAAPERMDVQDRRGASADPFADLAAALGDDPFALYEELAATGAAFPADHRAAMAAMLATSPNAAVCKAALGFVLSPDAIVADAALAALRDARPEGSVAAGLAAWLVQIRLWVGEERRPGIDAAMRSLRSKASAGAGRSVRPEVRLILASIFDGAGAQSLFALVRRGRRFAVVCLLVKVETGIADAWVRDSLTKAEADGFIGEVLGGLEAVEISIGLLERRLAHVLSVHLATGSPPPFNLLQVMEMLGLDTLRPDALPPAALVDTLLAGLPAEQTGAEGREAAHRESLTWMEEFETLASWFEAGEAVEALLRPLKTRKQRIAAVMAKLLPEWRELWAERCAWMAAILKEEAEPDERIWVDFALVAQDLAGQRPLDEIPLAHLIANATVEAFRRR